MKPKVAIISFPWKNDVPYKFLGDILDILGPVSEKLIVIDGNTSKITTTSEVEFKDIDITMHYANEYRPLFLSTLFWLLKSLIVQLKMSIQILKSTEVDIIIFYLAYPYYLLPLLTASILRKKTCEIITRSLPKSIPEKILSLQDPILFRLLSGISPESIGLIKELNLKRYEKKILPAGARFIDTNLYRVQKKLNERHKIGFISRIKKEKGICEFLEAIRIISSSKKDLNYLIAGDGDLTELVKNECEKIEKEFNVTVEFVGWVGNEMPDYLNELKLLVLPTKSDALPTIILESMSCGTPVLVSCVGSIGDVIDDSVTGFILKDTSPETIANSILNIIKNDHLDLVVENAVNLIEDGYTYNSAVKRWKGILYELNH